MVFLIVVPGHELKTGISLSRIKLSYAIIVL